MFSALETIKNTLLSFSPAPLSNSNITPKNIVENIYNNDNADSDNENEAIIDNPEPIKAEPERAQNHIDDKRPYSVNNLVSGEIEDFHFLHQNNLDQTYDFCDNGVASMTTYICMVGIDFQCNYNGERLPFLKFLMEHGTNIIDFPKCIIECNGNNDSEIYFQNECKKKVLDYFAIEGTLRNLGDFGERLNKLNVGYKELGPNKMVAVFDISSLLNIPLRTSKKCEWMVLDDLENQVLPISADVLRFFMENPKMKEIYDPYNNLVETPKSIYLCDIATHNFMLKSEKSSWIEPRSFHETYGNFYYFKRLHNVSYDNAPTICSYRKCVVFMKNYVNYIENDDTISLQGEHIETIAKYDSDLDLSDDEETEKPQQNEKSYNNESADDMPNNLPFVSLIMFSEKGEQYYCVKTESIFAEL